MIDQHNAYWRRIVDVLDEDVDGNRRLCNQLRIRRRQVVSGQCASRRGPGMPRLVVGTATGAALAAAVAMWWSPVTDQGGPVAQTVPLSSGGAETAVIRTVSLQQPDAVQSDFANNIDFYTWLERQTDTVADAGGD